MSEETVAMTIRRPQTIHLVATNPVEMEAARGGLNEWMKQKISSLDTDIIDLNRSIETARSNNWETASLARLRNKAVADQEFYAKLLQAAEAGFTIIPDFPIDIFAIKVERESPEHGLQVARYGRATVYFEEPDVLPAGEGEYVSSLPQVSHYKETRPDPNKEGHVYEARIAEPTGFADVVFPLRAARPEVMDATAQAMALKLFDQIGICPAERKADPLIIGQILHKKVGYTQKRVSFLIAWHLNLNEL